jgi:hypothetical protein
MSALPKRLVYQHTACCYFNIPLECKTCLTEEYINVGLRVLSFHSKHNFKIPLLHNPATLKYCSSPIKHLQNRTYVL